MKEEDDKKRQVDLQREMNEQAEQMMAEQQGGGSLSSTCERYTDLGTLTLGLNKK